MFDENFEQSLVVDRHIATSILELDCAEDLDELHEDELYQDECASSSGSDDDGDDIASAMSTKGSHRLKT